MQEAISGELINYVEVALTFGAGACFGALATLAHARSVWLTDSRPRAWTVAASVLGLSLLGLGSYLTFRAYTV